jgi:hypothetical protein
MLVSFFLTYCTY